MVEDLASLTNDVSAALGRSVEISNGLRESSMEIKGIAAGGPLDLEGCIGCPPGRD